MKIHPLYHRILAARLAEEGGYSGNLFTPDNAREKPLEAGSCRRHEGDEAHALSVEVDDERHLGWYSGAEAFLAGEDHLMLREDEILAILDS